jgi:hypothetical protein
MTLEQVHIPAHYPYPMLVHSQVHIYSIKYKSQYNVTIIRVEKNFRPSLSGPPLQLSLELLTTLVILHNNPYHSMKPLILLAINTSR